MDGIKPVGWAFAQDWRQFQADRQECRLLPNFYWGEDLSLTSDYAALYDQQAIDTLRAEVEDSEGAARVWRRRCQEAEARAERAEAALNLLERVLGPTVPTSVTSSGARCEWEEALKILAKAKAERT